MLYCFYIILILVLTLAAMTLLPLLTSKAWWVRQFDFPRLQLFILSLILITICFFFLDTFFCTIFIPILLLCIIYQGIWIIKYTILFPKDVKEAKNLNQSIKILTANVLMTNRNAEGLLSIINRTNPDIIITLETNKWWEEKLSPIEESYQYTVKCPLDNLYGMHLYSRHKLHSSQIRYIIEHDKPSIHTLVEYLDGKYISCHFLHPAPPSPTENLTSKPRDKELQVVAKEIAKLDVPVIVSGDLNDVAWSKTTRDFVKISQLKDPRVGRGMYNTYHAKWWFIRWPLDHFFHSYHFKVISMKRLNKFGSDHFPLFIELGLDD